jgi:predicted O-methyltransferase YrrM
LGKLEMASEMVRQRHVAKANLDRGLEQRVVPTRVSIKYNLVKANFFSKYLNAHETSILIELVKSVSPKVMIEFGCNVGITAKRVLENVPTLERYIGVDVGPEHVTTLISQIDEVPNRAGAYAAEDERFFLLTKPSVQLRFDDLEPCDAVFIDGDHSYPAVTYESLLAKRLLRPGGIIVWHDYGNPAVEVTRALESLCSKDWPIRSVEGSWLAFMRK